MRMCHLVACMQVQLQLCPTKTPVVPLRHIEVRFVSHYLPMQRTWTIYPALLLHAHKAMEAEPSCSKVAEHYARLTSLLSLICMAAALPLLHEIQCAIKALQARELYFPDLVKVLRKCQRNIKSAYASTSSFTSQSTFKSYLSLKAAALGKEQRKTSPLCFAKVEGHEKPVLHYKVKPAEGASTAIMLTAKPLPTGQRGRPSSLRQPISKSQLLPYFVHAEVRCWQAALLQEHMHASAVM